MKIQVTAEDIKSGFPGNPYMCPLAKAAARAYDRHVFVGTTAIKMEDTWCDLPVEAITFINRFDSNVAGIEPFEFELECYEKA
jgi:hypothetical protein